MFSKDYYFVNGEEIEEGEQKTLREIYYESWKQL